MNILVSGWHGRRSLPRLIDIPALGPDVQEIVLLSFENKSLSRRRQGLKEGDRLWQSTVAPDDSTRQSRSLDVLGDAT
ncbi:MAG: hypothetical protein O2931_06365 [Planctomycetota bacterium]|nr:hypothetical protein [Planctomycetota bacterium]MDA1178405.1 hypothetical protein [Planctomycetota bacterium]